MTAEGRALHDEIEIGLVEAELRQLEQWVRGGVAAERVQVGDEMAELAIRVDQIENAELAFRILLKLDPENRHRKRLERQLRAGRG